MESRLRAMIRDGEEEEVAFQLAAEPPQWLFAISAAKQGGPLPGKQPNKARDPGSRHIRLLDQYFVPRPIYNSHDFRRRFRVDREVFARLLEAVPAHDSYFVQRSDAVGKVGASALLKVTAAMRVLAYGCAADSLDENLELSETTVLESTMRFARAVNACFAEEYLRDPTPADVMRLLSLHASKGWPGKLGSIDCMHWTWSACPSAVAGQYLGRKGKPTVVLEAVADANLWIWHAHFGFPGSLNDLNILDRSHVFDRLMLGQAPAASFTVNGNTYDLPYMLADGIYPPWPVFVKTIEAPLDRKGQKYAKEQEASRKEVERTFGVLQARFRIIQQPFRMQKLEDMAAAIKCCMIIHNMMVKYEVANEVTEEDRLEILFEEAQQDPAVTRRIGLSQFTVSPPPAGSVPPSIVQLKCALTRIKRLEDHVALKADLKEHVWQWHGQQQGPSNDC
eukprot:GHVU01052669.1.p1 GENE.GHVU01052669.1~~GHVU01052669.1.p1  ORF type:complete len:450 (-),score=62.87 GHVU01052669.1:1582-2931(-)